MISPQRQPRSISASGIKVAADRIVSVNGPPLKTLPGWGILITTPGCEFHLHPPISYEVHYQVPLYVLVHAFTGAKARGAVGDGPLVFRSTAPRSSRLMGPDIRVRMIQDQALEFLALGFDPGRFEKTADHAVGSGRWRLNELATCLDPGLDALCREIRRCLIAEPIGQRRYLDALADAVVTRFATKHLLEDDTRKDTAEGLAPFLVRKLVAQVDAQLESGVKVSDLVETSGLSRSHFSRAFQRSFGEPPARYILGRRIARARELLTDPMLSVTEISIQCGFANPSHLTTAFHNEVGLPPKAYRKALSKDGK